MAEAIGNLVENAVKYTPCGGVVALRMRASAGGLVDAIARLHGGALTLADNHPGLIASLTLPALPLAASGAIGPEHLFTEAASQLSSGLVGATGIEPVTPPV